MPSCKRTYDELNKFSAFSFSRNVRARLCLRLCTKPSINSSRPILRKRPRYSKTIPFSPILLEECKENLPLVQHHANPTSSVPLKPVQAKSRSARIRFHQKVAVHRIPARHHYSDAVKRCMWSDLSEIREMARRNSIEFASEGYDWRRATEDDAMHLLPSGELVHPVWEQQRHFEPIQSTIRKREG